MMILTTSPPRANWAATIDVDRFGAVPRRAPTMLSRRLLNFLTALSLLLCVGPAVLWVLSPGRDVGASFTTSRGSTYSVTAAPHRLELKRVGGLSAD